MSNPLEELITPVAANRFLATISFHVPLLPLPIPSPIDIFFQKIHGLNRQMDVTAYREGGVNVGSLHLPEQVKHGRLVLERGVMTMTPLSWAFNRALSEFSFSYMEIVVSLLNHKKLPICNWIISDALPVSWQVGELDANSNNILINRLELAYGDMEWLGTKL